MGDYFTEEWHHPSASSSNYVLDALDFPIVEVVQVYEYVFQQNFVLGGGFQSIAWPIQACDGE